MNNYIDGLVQDCSALAMELLQSPGGGGYSVRKLMGVCRWPLKIGPKKIEGKIKFGA